MIARKNFIKPMVFAIAVGGLTTPSVGPVHAAEESEGGGYCGEIPQGRVGETSYAHGGDGTTFTIEGFLRNWNKLHVEHDVLGTAYDNGHRPC